MANNSAQIVVQNTDILMMTKMKQQRSNWSNSHHHHHHRDRKLIINNHHHYHQSSTDNINDLIHLEAPITEDSLIRSLHTRFLSNEYFVSIDRLNFNLDKYNSSLLHTDQYWTCIDCIESVSRAK